MPAHQLAPVIARLRAAGCVFAEDEARLLADAAQSPTDLELKVRQRIAGEPLEYVLGWAEFAGRRIAVDPGVFVPRRRTELLARQAAELAAQLAAEARSQPPIVVDMCCGTGAVGAVLAAAHRIELHAVDIDPAAVACARRNLPDWAAVYQGDLYQPLPATVRGRVDILIANAPYVPTEAIRLLPAEARLHEPGVALDGGADGLAVQRRIVARAPDWLAPGGHLLIETSDRQADLLAEAFAERALHPTVIRWEDLGATVVIGVKDLARPWAAERQEDAA